MPETIRLTENVYAGGTLAASAGDDLTPDRAYALGINDDGKVDRTLSTDQLRERAAGVARAAATSDDGTVDLDAALAATAPVSLDELP